MVQGVQMVFEQSQASFDPNSILALLEQHPYHVDSLLAMHELYRCSSCTLDRVSFGVVTTTQFVFCVVPGIAGTACAGALARSAGQCFGL